MTITNETIIKAARAAGIELRELPRENSYSYDLHIVRDGEICEEFEPLYDDTDNALIRRGAEIDVEWSVTLNQVQASAWLPDYTAASVGVDYGTDKARAERKAVILCAAAKWDAMQGEKA